MFDRDGGKAGAPSGRWLDTQPAIDISIMAFSVLRRSAFMQRFRVGLFNADALLLSCCFVTMVKSAVSIAASMQSAVRGAQLRWAPHGRAGAKALRADGLRASSVAAVREAQSGQCVARIPHTRYTVSKSVVYGITVLCQTQSYSRSMVSYSLYYRLRVFVQWVPHAPGALLGPPCASKTRRNASIARRLVPAREE